MCYRFYLMHSTSMYSVVIIINISTITYKLYHLFYAKITQNIVVGAVGIHFVCTRQCVIPTENKAPP